MPTSSSRKRLRVLIGSLAMLLALVAAAFVGVTDNINVPPRSLAPYVERRLSDHRPLLAQTGRWLARMLNELDRDETRISQRPLRIGTRLEAASAPVGATTHLVTVASPEQARQAIEHAQPGDVITFEPGTYRFLAGNIDAKQPGRPDAGITVRASRTGTVFIEMANQEGFVVDPNVTVTRQGEVVEVTVTVRSRRLIPSLPDRITRTIQAPAETFSPEASR